MGPNVTVVIRVRMVRRTACSSSDMVLNIESGREVEDEYSGASNAHRIEVHQRSIVQFNRI